jgi:hypothetical protein
MSLITELQLLSAAQANQARADCIAAGNNAGIADAMKEASWIMVGTIMKFKAVTTEVTAEAARKIAQYLTPYTTCGILPYKNPTTDFKQFLNNSRYVINKGEFGPTDGEARLFIDCLIQVNAEIEEVGVFSAHGSPTAEKSKKYDGIAVKFHGDHLAAKKTDGYEVAVGRKKAKSTSIDEVYAKTLESEVNRLNAAKVYQYAERYLELVFEWNPLNAAVDSLLFATRDTVQGWDYTGSKTGASTEFNKFTKGDTIKGHLIYAVKNDVSKETNRLLYHFELIVTDPKTVPAGKPWQMMPVDTVVKKFSKEFGGETTTAARALISNWTAVFYQTS